MRFSAILRGILGSCAFVCVEAVRGADVPSAASQVMDSTLDTRPGWDVEWHAGADRSSGTSVAGSPVGSMAVRSMSALAAEGFAAGRGFSWGAGFQYSELDLRAPASMPLPSRFQSEGLGLGGVWRPETSYGATIQALGAFSGQAGDFSAGTFNLTGTAQALWMPNDRLLLEGGLQFDTLGRYPVSPCGGVVFGIGSDVSVQLLFPQPRIAYAITRDLSAYLGANFEVQSYRTNGRFGSEHSQPGLNHAAFTAEEFFWGPGGTYRVLGAVTFDVGAGVVSERRFDFFRAGISVVPRSAPCLRASIVALF